MVVEVAGFVGEDTSLVLDSNGEPHIAYFYLNDPEGLPVGNLRYATRSGGVWTTETVDGDGGYLGEHTSIAIDSQGNPHITYYDNVGRL